MTLEVNCYESIHDSRIHGGNIKDKSGNWPSTIQLALKHFTTRTFNLTFSHNVLMHNDIFKVHIQHILLDIDLVFSMHIFISNCLVHK